MHFKGIAKRKKRVNEIEIFRKLRTCNLNLIISQLDRTIGCKNERIALTILDFRKVRCYDIKQQKTQIHRNAEVKRLSSQLEINKRLAFE